MRIYIPMTLDSLRSGLAAGALTPVDGLVFAVTPALRAEYPGSDDEELEYLAMADAARTSLRLLARGGGSPDPGSAAEGLDSPLSPGASAAAGWLRVVASADVAAVTQRPERDRSAAQLDEPVPWRNVASVHLDGAQDSEVVRAAAAALDLADLGDEDAALMVGEAEDIDLAWYAPGEVAFLLAEI